MYQRCSNRVQVQMLHKYGKYQVLDTEWPLSILIHNLNIPGAFFDIKPLESESDVSTFPQSRSESLVLRW